MRKVIDEINNKTDIVALVSSYVKLERRGKNYFGLCPFHDDSDPSMSVNPEMNFFKCFSCGVGGGPIKFYQEINHVTFNQAVAALAEPLGIKVNFKKANTRPSLPEHEILEEVNKFYQYTLKNSKLGVAALNYLKERKLKDETINHFQIGLSPKNNAIYKLLKKKNFTEEEMLNSGIVNLRDNEYKDFFNERIMFPITNIDGRVVGFSGRALGDKSPKYYNSADSKIFNKSEVLYHLYEALGDIRKQGYVIIHEGFFDCISSYEAGLKNTIATMGTALTINHAKLLENYTDRVILAFDGDNAGVNAAIKAIEVFKETKMRIDVLKIKEGLDPDDYYQTYGKEKYFKLYKSELKDQYEFIYNATKEHLNLKNTNDASILKGATRDMLVGASQSVKELYLKRLSEDLNVSVSSLTNEILRGVKKAVIKKEVVKKDKSTLPPKYYIAERQLLISMFRDKGLASKIEQELGSSYVCDIRAFRLRTILQYKYYTEHDSFDEEIFTALVKEEENSDEVLVLLNEIYQSIDYKQGFIFEEKDIEQQIKIVKDVVNKKGYLELKEEIQKEEESYQKTILIEKLKEEKMKKFGKKN